MKLISKTIFFLSFLLLFTNVGFSAYEIEKTANKVYEDLHKEDPKKLEKTVEQEILEKDFNVLLQKYKDMKEEKAKQIWALVQKKAQENLDKIEADEKAAEAEKEALKKKGEELEEQSERMKEAILAMAKESSYFSVTGNKKVPGKEKGEYEILFDPTLGLRATDTSQEAELVLGGEDSNNNLLTRIISLGMQFMGTIVILFFVIAAFFMITSRGDENQLQKGKTIFTYTIIGAVVAFTSYMVVQFVINIIFLSS